MSTCCVMHYVLWYNSPSERRLVFYGRSPAIMLNCLKREGSLDMDISSTKNSLDPYIKGKVNSAIAYAAYPRAIPHESVPPMCEACLAHACGLHVYEIQLDALI